MYKVVDPVPLYISSDYQSDGSTGEGAETVDSEGSFYDSDSGDDYLDLLRPIPRVDTPTTSKELISYSFNVSSDRSNTRSRSRTNGRSRSRSRHRKKHVSRKEKDSFDNNNNSNNNNNNRNKEKKRNQNNNVGRYYTRSQVGRDSNVRRYNDAPVTTAKRRQKSKRGRGRPKGSKNKKQKQRKEKKLGSHADLTLQQKLNLIQDVEVVAADNDARDSSRGGSKSPTPIPQGGQRLPPVQGPENLPVGVNINVNGNVQGSVNINVNIGNNNNDNNSIGNNNIGNNNIDNNNNNIVEEVSDQKQLEIEYAPVGTRSWNKKRRTKKAAEIVDKMHIWYEINIKETPIRELERKISGEDFLQHGFYSKWSRPSIQKYSRRDPEQLGDQFLSDQRRNYKKTSNSGRPPRFSPEEIVTLKEQFLERNHTHGESLRDFAKGQNPPIKYSALLRALKYHPKRNPTGLKAYKYRTRSYGFKNDEDFQIWKKQRLAVSKSRYNQSYKEFVFQDEGNCDSNKTFNASNNVFWKRVSDPTPVPVIVKSKFRNQANWTHFSVMFTYDKKIGIDFFTKEGSSGLESVKLDRELFIDKVMKRFETYTEELNQAQETARTLLMDGATIHTGKTYKWLEERNLKHLKSWSKRRQLDVDAKLFHTSYSADLNPVEFIIYLCKNGAK